MCRGSAVLLWSFFFFHAILLVGALASGSSLPSKQSSLRLRKVCKPQHSVACDDAFRLCPQILQSCDSFSAIESVTLSLTSAVLCDRSRLSGALFFSKLPNCILYGCQVTVCEARTFQPCLSSFSDARSKYLSLGSFITERGLYLGSRLQKLGSPGA